MGTCVTKAPAEQHQSIKHILRQNFNHVQVNKRTVYYHVKSTSSSSITNISTSSSASTTSTASIASTASTVSTALVKDQTAANIAIFGLQCGIQLFCPNLEEVQLQFNLSNLHNLSFDIEEPKFIEAMNYFCDAFSSVGDPVDSNYTLHNDKISKAYDLAIQSKKKITENANNLLGVYSIIIVCGFYIHSDFGNDLFGGLTHIKNVLNEINQQPLLTKRLKEILESVLYYKSSYNLRTNAPVQYWNKSEEQYVQNVVLFGVMVRRLVQNVVIFSENNADIKNECLSAECNKLLNYKVWTPNLFDGTYFGGESGDICKFQICVDFFKRIYPIIFNQNLQHEITFINQYHEELIAYLKQLNDISLLNELDKINNNCKPNNEIKQEQLNADLKNVLTGWWFLNVYD